MPTDELPAGIRAVDVETSRLKVRVLERDNSSTEAEPVLLVHGNVSSSLFFVDLINALPDRFRPIAPDLRGYGGTDPLPIDASRGLQDWADDLLALADALGLQTFHLLGWSMGGGVTVQMLLQAPERVRTLTLQAPVSPYGFGGTRGQDGELLSPDGAGSGGGCANPRFVELLAAGDTGTEDQTSLSLASVMGPPRCHEHGTTWRCQRASRTSPWWSTATRWSGRFRCR